MSLNTTRLICGGVAVIAYLTAGCGGTNYTPSRTADPATALHTLTIALDAWKSGAASNALVTRSPKVFVGDEDWFGGHVLKDYKLIGAGESYGNDVRFQVGLELSAKPGEKVKKTVRYLVATDPVLRVTRDDRSE